MKKILGLIIAIYAVFLFSGCGAMNEPTPQMQGKIYTQVNMWEEKGKILGTNYQRGRLIPVNTQIKILGYSSNAVKFMVEGESIEIQFINVEKFTRLTMEQLMPKLFDKNKVNLSKFPQKVKKAIELGNVENGMTKEQVLIARGIPPAHVTPSTNSNVWKYWQNRFVTRDVQFENGKVVGLFGWGTGNN